MGSQKGGSDAETLAYSRTHPSSRRLQRGDSPSGPRPGRSEPGPPTVAHGQTLNLTLTFTSQNGFQGEVSLSVTENGRNPSWLTLSPTSKYLNVPKGG